MGLEPVKYIEASMTTWDILKERVANAGLLMIFGIAVVVPLWYVSVGFYALGLWPLGAVLRAFIWGVALFVLYWIARHLFGFGGHEQLLRDFQRRQLEGFRGYEDSQT
jgi:hypothetical protein